MKKFLFLLALIVPMIAFMGCGGDDDEPENPGDSGKTEITNKVLTGVWECGDKFVSFASDGFCCAYLDDKYIASGSYSISGKVVKCNNVYYGTELVLEVSSLKSDSFQSAMKYVDFEGNLVEDNLKFQKSDKTPTPKENILIGKAYSVLGSYTDGSGMYDDIYSFNSYNSATVTRTMKSGLKDSKTKNLNYIYLAPNLYYQQFKPTGSPLHSFYNNCGTGQVFIREVTIENGQIKDID